MKIAWITDSTCGLPLDFIKEHEIHVLPLSVIVNGKSYKDDIDITKDEFYSLLKEHGDGAKTSQPSYGDFISLYEKLKEEYDCGIAVHASSELTGTYQSSISASEMTGFPVEVVDSKIGSYPLGKMIRNGLQLQKEGKQYDQIIENMKRYPELAEMYLLPANLDQLKKSGRVSTTQSVFATLMNINLLLKFDNGKVVVSEKIRNKKRAIRRLFQIIDEAVEKHQLKEICIIHAGVKEQAYKWKEEIEKAHHELKVEVEPLVPVAGVHTGYGTMSVGWLKEK
ncbi:DegV family EDD domain-containing protein [Aquibacillus halophilus]|uniref:DegV family EDD domain-containing protein n=1 Tax=Aquibacillus halophilus TaxID=930132 RepID=A0A6A8DKV1_9BACI|nr:DegV family protein [Aquibacillus halophilus]MRH45106.1 DegV family EDD domain-containing protein [Aquibacillus halophilus]